MSEPKRKISEQPVFDLGVELTQEIDSPFGDFLSRRDEPTLTKIDFEDIELLLDV
jgi:hypothetical protein